MRGRMVGMFAGWCVVVASLTLVEVPPAAAAVPLTPAAPLVAPMPAVQPFTARLRPRHPRVRPAAHRTTTGASASSPTAGVAAPAPTTTFPGIGRGALAQGWAPETAGDVGPNVYVQAVDAAFAIFRKSDGAVLASSSFSSLFAAAKTGTACDEAQSDAPQVLYDTQTDRWILGILSWSDSVTGPFYECLAVSASGDPTATWRLYPVQLDPSSDPDPKIYDGPRLAVWIDGIYMAANVSDASGSVSGVQAFVFNRTDLESGAALRWQATPADPTGTSLDGSESSGVVPTSMKSAAAVPAPGTPAYFVANSGSDYQLDIWRYTVNWTTPSSSTFRGGPNNAGPIDVPFPAFRFTPDGVLEPSPGNPLSPPDENILGVSEYATQGTGSNKHFYLWVAFTVAQGPAGAPAGRTGIDWFQVRLDGGITGTQQAVYMPDQASRFGGSLAVDRNDDMALGYAVTSSSTNSSAGDIYPSIRYAGRITTDASNTLGQTEQTMYAGTGYQCCSFDDGNLNDAWGPLGSLTLDPDGCTFWYTNEYYDTSPTTLAQDSWKTRIGSFRLPGCAASALTTSLAAANATGGYGGTTSLSATLTASGTGSGASGEPVTFKLNGASVGTSTTNASGVATLSGVSLSGIAQGTYAGAISASFAGSDAYGASGPAAASLTVGIGSQTIVFPVIPDRTIMDPSDFSVSAAASSGLPVTFTSSGVCAVSGSTVHTTGAGSCTITASQAGDANHAAAAPVSRSFTITKATQTITFGALPDRTFGDADVTVIAATSSGLDVSFTSGGVCTVSGSTVHLTGAGACTVTAAQSGNAIFASATAVLQSFTVAKAGQTITFPAIPDHAFGDADFSINATASSGSAVSWSVSGTCGVSGTTLHLAGPGVCSVTASQAGSANYLAATPVTRSFNIAKTPQTIALADPGPQSQGIAFTVHATASSGLAVAYTGDAVCSVSGSTVTPSRAGSCTITAHQGGNGTFAAAPDVSVAVQIAVTRASQTISAFTVSNSGAIVNRSVNTTQALSLTATSGLTVVYSVTTPATCTVSGGTLTFTGIGMCAVLADQPGDLSWQPAPEIGPRTYSVANKGSQTITFPLSGTMPQQPDFTIAATSSSGLTVGFSSLTNAVCTVSGSIVHPLANGTCTIHATQPGDANWLGATPVDATVTIVGGKFDQAISFPAVPDRTFGDPDFTASATASSGLSVSFLASGSCVVTGSTIHISGAGMCSLTALQAGNTSYNAAPQIQRSFSIAKAPQTIAFDPIPDHILGDPDVILGATASSGMSVTYAAYGNCSVGGAVLHLTGAGSCTIAATQIGDANHAAAAEVLRSFTIGPPPVATSTMLSLGAAKVKHGKTLTMIGKVSALSGVPAGLVSFLIDGVSAGSCSLSPKGKCSLSVVITQSVGTYQVQAAFRGGAVFASSSSATTVLKVT